VERFVALVMSGLASGSIYALVALGIVLLQNATGVINFAQGDLMTLGAYVGFWFVVDQHGNQILMYLVVFVALFIAGVALERVGYAPLRRRPPLTIIISTFALGIAIRSAVELWKGSSALNLPSPFGIKTVKVFSAPTPEQNILTIGVTIAVGVVLFLVFQRSSIGRQVRALAADRETALLQGVRVNRLVPLIFGLSSALAGVAGVLIAPQLGVSPTLGFGLLLAAFAAVILGGERLGGVAFSAIFIALFQSLATGYISPNYGDAYPFLVLVLVLAVRPQGLVRVVTGVRF
jgi:branched-chain amino acid transport system permease protein